MELKVLDWSSNSRTRLCGSLPMSSSFISLTMRAEEDSRAIGRANRRPMKKATTMASSNAASPAMSELRSRSSCLPIVSPRK